MEPPQSCQYQPVDDAVACHESCTGAVPEPAHLVHLGFSLFLSSPDAHAGWNLWSSLLAACKLPGKPGSSESHDPQTEMSKLLRLIPTRAGWGRAFTNAESGLPSRLTSAPRAVKQKPCKKIRKTAAATENAEIPPPTMCLTSTLMHKQTSAIS